MYIGGALLYAGGTGTGAGTWLSSSSKEKYFFLPVSGDLAGTAGGGREDGLIGREEGLLGSVFRDRGDDIPPGDIGSGLFDLGDIPGDMGSGFFDLGDLAGTGGGAPLLDLGDLTPKIGIF